LPLPHTDPDILLIDEVLAVGDLAFQRKCLQRILQFKADGCALVLVSHDMQLVRQLCDHVVWLAAGRMAAHGAADAVIRQYESEMNAETRRRTPHAHPPARTPYGAELRVNENRFGSLELEIVAVRLLNAAGLIVSELDRGEPLRVAMEYVCREDIQAAIFGVTSTREDDLICDETSTEAAGLTFSPPRGRRADDPPYRTPPSESWALLCQRWSVSRGLGVRVGSPLACLSAGDPVVAQ